MADGMKWDEHSRGECFKEGEIDIRACKCGSIHLTFFGRTSIHLSHQEFLDFSKGVLQISSKLKQFDANRGLVTLRNNGLVH